MMSSFFTQSPGRSLAAAALLAGIASHACHAATLVQITTFGREYTYDSAEGALIHPTGDVERRGTGHASFPNVGSVDGSNWLVNGVSFDIRGLSNAGLWNFLPWSSSGAWTIGFSAGESARTGYRELLPGAYDAPHLSGCTLALGFNHCSPSLTVEGPRADDIWQSPLLPLPWWNERVQSIDARELVDDDILIFDRPTLSWQEDKFTIHEAVYGPNGEVLSFAADFEQFDASGESILSGKLRYNSNVPVPEPTTLCLLIGSTLAATTWRPRR